MILVSVFFVGETNYEKFLFVIPMSVDLTGKRVMSTIQLFLKTDVLV